MKGIIVKNFGSSDVLEYSELPDPVPGDNQVLIEVHGASINSADIQARSGKYHLGKNLPYTPGIDVAGVVKSTGPGVKTVKRGAHVIAFPLSGSYSEMAIAEEHLTFVIPPEIDFKVASAIPIVAGTVTHMLTEIARITPEESLLVHGAGGGVGTTAIQIAKSLGIRQIIGSVGSPRKGEYVKKIGADATIDYENADYPTLVNHLTDGSGVDVILNPIGGSTLERDVQCLAPFGRLISFGKLKDKPGAVSPEILYTTNRSIIGFSFGHYRKLRPDLISQTMQRVITMVKKNQLTMVIDSCFELKEAAAAHHYLESRKAVGKVLLFPINH